MKICFLAGASSVHTVRWVNAMVERGHTVDLITMHPDAFQQIDHRVTVHSLLVPPPLGYYANRLQVRGILYRLQPDLLHVHYASGYGTLARKIAYRPIVLSVWGSDVFLFPYQNKWNQNTLRKNLANADQITATGASLHKQTTLFVTPVSPIKEVAFGIDTQLFSPVKKSEATNDIYIGTVKRLKEVYGIDIMLKALAALLELLTRHQLDDIGERIKIMVVGSGPELEPLKQQAADLKISDKTTFIEEVPNDKVPHYLNQLDIYCAFSRSESFGVAVLEASACGVPVVTSNVGGLPEVVDNGVTGYLTDLDDVQAMSEKLFELVVNTERRTTMGKNGREFVQRHYNWDENVTEMEQVYRSTLYGSQDGNDNSGRKR